MTIKLQISNVPWTPRSILVRTTNNSPVGTSWQKSKNQRKSSKQPEEKRLITYTGEAIGVTDDCPTETGEASHDEKW